MNKPQEIFNLFYHYVRLIGRTESSLLTKGCIKLFLRQMLVVVEVIVLQQVEQRAVRDVFGETFMLDDLQREGFHEVFLLSLPVMLNTLEVHFVLEAVKTKRY